MKYGILLFRCLCFQILSFCMKGEENDRNFFISKKSVVQEELDDSDIDGWELYQHLFYSGDFTSYNNWRVDSAFVHSDGIMKEGEINDRKCAQYTRKGNLYYDSITYLSNNITFASNFITHRKVFTLDIFTANLPNQTEIMVHLDNHAAGKSFSSTVGRHSEYTAFTGKSPHTSTDGWERVIFRLNKIWDSSVKNVNQIRIYFSPSVYDGSTFYWDNFNIYSSELIEQNYALTGGGVILDSKVVIYDFDGLPNATITQATGNLYEEVANPDPFSTINSSPLVAQYTRNESLVYDLIHFNISVIDDMDKFYSGDYLFSIDIFSTELPEETEIRLEFMDSSRYIDGDHYPLGVHSKFLAFTGSNNEWERLLFRFNALGDKDVSPYEIDTMIIHFVPNTFSGATFYWDNFVFWALSAANNMTLSSILNNFDGVSNVTLHDVDGVFLIINNPDPFSTINNSPLVAQYTRNESLVYDSLYFNISVIDDADEFYDGYYKFVMDIYNANNFPESNGEIRIELHNFQKMNAAGAEFPQGVHSRYTASVSGVRDEEGWVTVEFEASEEFNGGVLPDEVDSMTVMFAPGLVNDAHTIIWDNFYILYRQPESDGYLYGTPTLTEDFEGGETTLDYIYSNGILSTVENPDKSPANPSIYCGFYSRTEIAYDVIVVHSTVIEDADSFITGKSILSIDLLTNDLPIGSEILFQFICKSKSSSNWPDGIHSQYIGYSTTDIGWETIVPSFFSKRDLNVFPDEVDTIDMMLLQGKAAAANIYWDNFQIFPEYKADEVPRVHAPIFSLLDFEEQVIEFVRRDGTLTTSFPNPSPQSTINISPSCAYYTRSSYQYDVIQFKTNLISDASKFVEGEHMFYMDIRAGSLPPGSKVVIQLEISQFIQEYPLGRHSRYFGYVSDDIQEDDWESVRFTFEDAPDTTISDIKIDSIAILFTPEIQISRNIVWDNLEVYGLSDVDDVDSDTIPLDKWYLKSNIENFESTDSTSDYIFIIESLGTLEMVDNPNTSNTINDSIQCARYRRTLKDFDYISFATNLISDASKFSRGAYKFVIDIYVTDEFKLGDKVTIQLENLEKSAAESYPLGRHSAYESNIITETSDLVVDSSVGYWKTLEFKFKEIPDPNFEDDEVDSIFLFFFPGVADTQSPRSVFWDSLRVERAIPLTQPQCVTDDGWRDKNGYSCSQYESNEWCFFGHIGGAWYNQWGYDSQLKDFSDSMGFSALDKCCECTLSTTSCESNSSSGSSASNEGSNTLVDKNNSCCSDTVGWVDLYGKTCTDYYESSWCKGNGVYGSKWLESFGPGVSFADLSPLPNTGFTGGADENCCLCKDPWSSTANSNSGGTGDTTNQCIDATASEWKDSEGKSCEVYNIGEWCDGATVGAGWIGRHPTSVLTYDGISLETQSFSYSPTGQITGVGVNCDYMITPGDCYGSVPENICIIDFGWEFIDMEDQIRNCAAAGGIAAVIMSKSDQPLSIIETNLDPSIVDILNDILIVSVTIQYKSVLLNANSISIVSQRGLDPEEYADFAGFSAKDKCCSCLDSDFLFRSSECQNSIIGWRDLDGYSCEIYENENWCDGGNLGQRWDRNYGTLGQYANSESVDASDACCSCQGIVSDTDDVIDSSVWEVYQVLWLLLCLWLSLGFHNVLEWWRIETRNYVKDAILSPGSYQHFCDHLFMFPALTSAWCRCFTKFIELKMSRRVKNLRWASLGVTVLFAIFGFISFIVEVFQGFKEFRVSLIYMYPVFWCCLILAMWVEVISVRKTVKVYNENKTSMEVARRLYRYGLINSISGFGLSLFYVVVRRFNPGQFASICFDVCMWALSSGFMYLLWPTIFRTSSTIGLSVTPGKTPLSDETNLKRSVIASRLGTNSEGDPILASKQQYSKEAQLSHPSFMANDSGNGDLLNPASPQHARTTRKK